MLHIHNPAKHCVVCVSGGGEGSRTPVRKHLDITFSERSLSFTFPRLSAGKQAHRLGSFIIHGAGKAYRAHVHH